jgi:exodeoxyribonuclease VII large subunit
LISPITISELTDQIKSLVEQEFKFVYIVGEISNFKMHTASGHFYFVLKDENAQVSALMWNSRNKDLYFTPEEGMKVIVKGRITLYKTRGTYQVDVFEMEPFGMGELQIAFDKLKEKLLLEGLFDEEFKKPILRFPSRVGLITSETAAALHDFKNVTSRRYPSVELILFPALMQGAGSAKSVCNAIRVANKQEFELDIIVITRGGGSIEDLWTFNEEAVAREVFNSNVPVVSAIGHEIDYTICDFVADLRAPTPSAAAEMIFPDKTELLERINQFDYNLKIYLSERINFYHSELENISKNYFFNKPLDLLGEYSLKIDEYRDLIGKVVKNKFDNLNNELSSIEKLFFNIGPEQTLKRGFSYVLKDGKIISRKRQLQKDDEIMIRFQDGDTSAIIN